MAFFAILMSVAAQVRANTRTLRSFAVRMMAGVGLADPAAWSLRPLIADGGCSLLRRKQDQETLGAQGNRSAGQGRLA